MSSRTAVAQPAVGATKRRATSLVEEEEKSSPMSVNRRKLLAGQIQRAVQFLAGAVGSPAGGCGSSRAIRHRGVQDEYVGPSWRERFSNYMLFSTLGKAYNLMQFLLGLLSITLYVYSTYIPVPNPSWMNVVEICLASLFTIDFVLQMFMTKYKIRYLYTWGVVDILTIFPVVFVFTGNAG